MPGNRQEDGREHIPTNLRLLVMIEEIVKAGAPVAPSALSDSLGLPRATIHRLLVTAENEGFLQRDIDGRSYGPGKRLRHLSANTLSTQRMRTERLIVMQALASDVGETCNLSAPARFGMVYLDRVETHWPLRIQLPVGTQVPFHCTAGGKMYLSMLRKDKLARLLKNLDLKPQTQHSLTDPDSLLSELALSRTRGYSTDNEEFMDGMAAVAVPILDDRGRLLSALAIHAPVQRHRLDSLQEFLPRLHAAAEKLRAIVLD